MYTSERVDNVKNKIAGVNSRFAKVSEAEIAFKWLPFNFVEITSCVYTKTIILFNLGE